MGCKHGHLEPCTTCEDEKDLAGLRRLAVERGDRIKTLETDLAKSRAWTKVEADARRDERNVYAGTVEGLHARIESLEGLLREANRIPWTGLDLELSKRISAVLKTKVGG